MNSLGGSVAWRDRLFLAAAGALAFLVVVFPNSLRSASVPVFVVAAALSVPNSFSFRGAGKVYWVWVAGFCVTLFYCLIGACSGAPGEAIAHAAVVFALAPLVWIAVCLKLCDLVSPDNVARALIWLGVLGGISVYLFIYMFMNYGSESVAWLIAEPNVEAGEGYFAATMHVFGSLIFVCAGVFAAPSIIRRQSARFLVVIVLGAAALVSGRAALVVAMAVGMVVGVFAWLMGVRERSVGRAAVAYGSIFILAFFLIGAFVDLSLVVGALVEKIGEGGGEARVEQAMALWGGIGDSIGLGAGHGIGVSVVRDEQYPWRYELLWLSTVHRVGFIGALVYAIPFLFVVFSFFRRIYLFGGGVLDNFMFAGCVAAILASGTNPYLESIDFQWMLFLPFVYFAIGVPVEGGGGARHRG